MAWVKVDDGFSDHPKAIGLDLAATGLWLHALCYANRHTTDGFVPAGLLRRLGDPNAQAAAEQLVDAGLWVQTDGGWAIHDYLAYQRSRAEIVDLGEKRAEAGRKGGQARTKQTATNPAATYPAGDTLPEQRASKSRATASNRQAEEEREEEREREPTEKDDDARAARPAAPAVASVPFALVEALCEELGEDVSVLGRKGVEKQCAAGKRLAADGFAADDVRRMVRWLKAQDWVTGGIDLFLVEKQADKWKLAGRPDAVARRAGGRGASAGFLADVMQIAQGG